MIDYNEQEMAKAFEIALNTKQVKGLPDFALIYNEFACKQGIPDFIGVPFLDSVMNREFSKLTMLESSSMVLSLLKYNSGRRKRYIKEKTDLSDSTVNKVLKELLSNNFIVEKDGLYYLSILYDNKVNDIWAFELKLSNWRRALFQSLQYKAFANYVIAVFPYEKEKILKQNIAIFKELNVGVLLFDARNMVTKWIRRPVKEKSVSRWQTIFFQGKLSILTPLDDFKKVYLD